MMPREDIPPRRTLAGRGGADGAGSSPSRHRPVARLQETPVYRPEREEAPTDGSVSFNSSPTVAGQSAGEVQLQLDVQCACELKQAPGALDFLQGEHVPVACTLPFPGTRPRVVLKHSPSGLRCGEDVMVCEARGRYTTPAKWFSVPPGVPSCDELSRGKLD